MNQAKKYNILYLILITIFLLVSLYLLTKYLNISESMVNINKNEIKDLPFGEDDSSEIPKVIWTFWEGEESLLVNRCIESWKHYNPDYEINILNKSNYREYIDYDIDSIRHSSDSMARYSDYIRCLVLAKYGGFWIDASIICHHSFGWLHAIQNKTKVEFIGYYIDKFTTNYDFPVIESWFFACIPNSQFMNDWCREFYSTRKFNRIQEYVDYVKEQKIDLQNIDVPDYLAIHVAAQKTLQSNPDKYNIYLFSVCSGPYSYLCKHDWNADNAVRELIDADNSKDYYKYSFIKIRGIEREILEKYDDDTIKNAFSNITER